MSAIEIIGFTFGFVFRHETIWKSCHNRTVLTSNYTKKSAIFKKLHMTILGESNKISFQKLYVVRNLKMNWFNDRQKRVIYHLLLFG